MKRILITGSSGMLGQEIVKALASNNRYELFGFDKTHCPQNDNYLTHINTDITNNTILRNQVNQIKPDLTIHLAAIVNLKFCEDNFNIARALHVDTSRILAQQSPKIIYISTDSVFNGELGNYTETCLPDPLNNYAITKLLGEYAVRANNNNHLLIRTNIFGINNPLKGSLAEWGLSTLNKGETISGFTNVIFNAIYTKHLAQIISKSIATNLLGIINIASTTAMSKYDFLVTLAEVAGYPKSKVNKAVMSNNSNIMRPLDTSLCVNYAKTLYSLPTIEEGIIDLVTDYKRENRNDGN